MEQATKNQFLERLRASDKPEEFAKILRIIRDVISGFSRDQDDIDQISRAIRTAAKRFDEGVKIKIKQPSVSSEDKKTKGDKSVPQEIEVDLRQYAQETADWVSGLKSLICDPPPPPQKIKAVMEKDGTGATSPKQ